MIDRQSLDRELRALAALSDEEIDTTDISETVSFEGAQRARYLPLTQRGYDIRAIANWCIEKAASEGRRVGTLWLNKIVYFIYEKGIQDVGVLFSNARAEAWKHGPVFREIYFDEKVERQASPLMRFNKRSRKMEIASEDFNSDDIVVFENIWANLGHKSGTELRALSHTPDSPWFAIWEHSKNGNLGLEIDVATILGSNAAENGRERNKD